MQNSHDTQIQNINRELLTALVQQVLDDKEAVPSEWTCQPVHGGVGYGTAVYRVSGVATSQSGNVDWSVILKILFEQTGQNDASAWFYWKREADFYQSSWVGNLPPNIRSAKCYSVTQAVNDVGTKEQWLWLEDVKEGQNAQWSLTEFHRVADHMGQFNGAYLCGRTMPSEPWLNSEGISSVVDQCAPAMHSLQENMDHPLVKYWLRNGKDEDLFQWWADRELYSDFLRGLPKTLCHFDAVEGNLFLDTQSDTVTAIDWSYVGHGGVGTEILPLVIVSLFRGSTNVSQAAELDRAVFDGYLNGLRRAGWQENADLARLGFTAAAIYPSVSGIQMILEWILDEERREQAEKAMNVTIRDIVDQSHAVLEYIGTLLKEARELHAMLK